MDSWQVDAQIVSKVPFESDDTKMVRITVAMLPDMIDGGTQYIKDAQNNLETIAKYAKLTEWWTNDLACWLPTLSRYRCQQEVRPSRRPSVTSN